MACIDQRSSFSARRSALRPPVSVNTGQGGDRPVVSHESDETERSHTHGSFFGKRSWQPQQFHLIGDGGDRLALSRPAALSVTEGTIGIPFLFLCLADTEGVLPLMPQ